MRKPKKQVFRYPFNKVLPNFHKPVQRNVQNDEQHDYFRV